MNKSNLRKLIKEELSNKILYKVIFKPDYVNDSEKPHDPIYIYMTLRERLYQTKYAVIDKILGLGNKDYNTLPAKEKINSIFVKDMAEFKRIIKSLSKTKNENKIIKEGLTRKDIDLIRSIIRQELAEVYKIF